VIIEATTAQGATSFQSQILIGRIIFRVVHIKNKTASGRRPVIK